MLEVKDKEISAIKCINSLNKNNKKISFVMNGLNINIPLWKKLHSL